MAATQHTSPRLSMLMQPRPSTTIKLQGRESCFTSKNKSAIGGADGVNTAANGGSSASDNKNTPSSNTFIGNVSIHVRSRQSLKMEPPSGTGGGGDDINNSITTSTTTPNQHPCRPSEVMRLAACEMARQFYREDFYEGISPKDSPSLERILKEETLQIPKFDPEEITKGPVLGSGGFGIVYEIVQFELSKQEEESPETSEPTSGGASSRSKAKESRQFIAEHCLRPRADGVKGKNAPAIDARYAIKMLKPEIMEDQSDLSQSVLDMNVETRILGSTEHPNIIKLRAISKGARFHQDYFLVLDRLYDTLEARIDTWRQTKNRYNGVAGVLFRGKKKELLQERLQAGCDLCSALAYLHEQRILHRDLKPENIGFDIRNDIKLFDFGLSKLLPPAKEADSQGRFCMSVCGSYRYMPPEVALEQPYNETCDVYSMAVVLWEMLALKPAFANYKNDDALVRNVFTPPYKRPKIKDTWPTSIQSLIHSSWHPTPSSRPSMKHMEECLGEELGLEPQYGSLGGDVNGKGAANATTTSTNPRRGRRSTHVFQWSS